MNSVFKYLHHKYSKATDKWYPMFSVFYLTYACGFRCSFCSDGSGKPYHAIPNKILPADEVIKLLGIIRNKCDYVVITGGEPLNYPAFLKVIAGIKSLRFKEVILTTNGYNFENYIAEIADSVTTLVFSLNTLDPKKADKFYGRDDVDLNKILNNIELANEYKNKKYEINISSVVTPGNINELYNVYDFSKKRGFIFAACPQLVGVKAHSLLNDDIDYKDFYNFLISEKKKGCKIFGTLKYLEKMRDLKKFNCYPFTMLVVSPTGEAYYPCLEIGHLAGNLLENDDLHDLRLKGQEKFGPKPDCDNRCHSACSLGFSTMIKHPGSVISDAYLQIKGSVFTGFID